MRRQVHSPGRVIVSPTASISAQSSNMGYRSAMPSAITLDKINRQILIELQQNARISNIDLAERVNLSPSACLKRLRALEQAGCIRNYLMVADVDRFAEVVEACLLVHMKETSQEATTRFEAFCASETQICDCMRVSGEPDYILFVACSELSEVHALMNALMEPEIKVARVNLQIMLNRTKWLSGYPFEKLKWRDRVKTG